MADISREDVIDYFKNLSVVDAAELADELEEELGIEAGAAVAAPAAGAAQAEGDEEEEEEEKSVFDVSLDDFGDNKIKVIKAVRGVTDLGLKDAKELVENVPSTIKEQVDKETADDIEEQIEDAGGSVELK
jgi:large subunit ribosomal protein L7/L12